MLRWPAGVKSVVFFTFDFDAETLWFCRNPANWEDALNRSRGAFAAYEGVPRILDMLARNEIKSTFFIPGWVIEQYGDVVKRIHEEGHEIAYHGYTHETVDTINYEEENRLMDKCEAIIKNITGKKPIGHRSPNGGVHPYTFKMLQERGYLYSANMMDRNMPYFHKIDGVEIPVLEFPSEWMYDDSSYYFFTLQEPVRRGIASARTLFDIWVDEFDGLYDEGKMLNLIIHPQLSGRTSRVKTLEKLIQHVKSRPGAWITRIDEVAHFLSSQFRGGKE